MDLERMQSAFLARCARLRMPVDPAVSAGPLALDGGKLWRLREPSGRLYSIIRLGTRGGVHGFGGAGCVEVTELKAAMAALLGREATAYETVAVSSGLQGAVKMAMLVIVGKATQAPLYQVLGGPTWSKAQMIATVVS